MPAGAHPAAVAGAGLRRRPGRRPGVHRRRRHGAGPALGADRLRVRRTGGGGLHRPGHGAVAVPAGRLADRHAGLGAARRGRDRTPAALEEGVVRSAEQLLPLMRELQDYVWRRHLAANAGRLFVADPARSTAGSWPSGFADLVGYTSRRRGMGGRELGAMVEDFEGLAADVIARHHGRVVKTVGDGVLFTCAGAGRRGGDRAAAAGGVDRRRPAAAAGRRRLRRGAHPARRRLLPGGQPGQPAHLARPALHRAGRPAAGPAAARARPATGCGRCAGCRCAGTTTSSRGWSAAGTPGRRPRGGRARGAARRDRRRRADDGTTTGRADWDGRVAWTPGSGAD